MAQEEVKEIILRAIRMEENSFELYSAAASRVKDPAAKAGLEDLAGQEKQHKAKLEKLLSGDLRWTTALSRKKAKDLKIGGPLEAKPLGPSSDLQDVLTLAIKREEASGALYAQMASLLDPGPEKDLFELLSNEESRHKLYVEGLYEKEIYKDF